MLKNKIGYSYQDVTIVPKMNCIEHRGECNTYVTKDNMLPIFTASMSTVVNTSNALKWKNNGIEPIIPRNVPLDDRYEMLKQGYWVSVGLTEVRDLICYIETHPQDIPENIKVNIDVANGHMKKLYESAMLLYLDCQTIGKKAEIMVGNIANPKDYFYISRKYRQYIHYIKVGIGGGAGCLTSTQTGVHYPMASLVSECYRYKKHWNWLLGHMPKIIADGGVRGYGDAIKALGLGADYVMIGSIFASLLESAAPVEFTNEVAAKKYKFIKNGKEEAKRKFLSKYEGMIKKTFYGMSTKKAQKMINGNASALKTSEGCFKTLDVTHTMVQWCDNFVSYLRSAMSYCGAKDLKHFIGKATFIINSPGEVNRVNK